MTNNKFFIGIDVSKPYFDVSLMPVIEHQKQAIVSSRFNNTSKGLLQFLKWLKANKVSFDINTLVVIENTGVYHRLLWQFFSKHSIPLHIGNAAHIKWSFGIARGKNDLIDSIRLCQYAFKENDALKHTQPINNSLMEVKDLMTSRKNLLQQLRGIEKYLRELKTSNNRTTQSILEKAHKQAIEGLKKSILEIEVQLKKIITTNQDLEKNYSLLTTIPGIGRFTAMYLISCTHNFTNNVNGKQLACYAGVVPFEHSSGISIKGRNRVHKMANKDLKAMLHLGALVCIQRYPEFKEYYQRKKQEGKHALCILNAIKNKLLLRVAAVIKNQKAYIQNNQFENQEFRKNYLQKA